jgi:hypothetical protein
MKKREILGVGGPDDRGGAIAMQRAERRQSALVLAPAPVRGYLSWPNLSMAVFLIAQAIVAARQQASTKGHS